MKKNGNGLGSNLWVTSGFTAMFVAIITVFLIGPIILRTAYSHLIVQGCFLAILLSTLYILSDKTISLVLGITLCIPFIFLNWFSILHNSLYWMTFAYGFYCLYLILVIAMLGRKLFKAPIINMNLIFGALTIYLLAGILWAKIYFLYDLLYPNSFTNLEPIFYKTSHLHEGYLNQFSLLYYSFTVLTTLGLGDIAPLHHFSKSLTILEAIFGQLYVATALAKMISIYRRNETT